jgi:hypothetical protein
VLKQCNKMPSELELISNAVVSLSNGVSALQKIVTNNTTNITALDRSYERLHANDGELYNRLTKLEGVQRFVF